MIKQIFKSLICSTKDHNFIEAGKCPFTGNEYKLCTRCEKMVTK